jgi:predicted small secreted protein
MFQSRKLLLALIGMLITGTFASGCNTFKGAGKDIQKGGQAVENAAEEVQDGK